MVEITEDEFKDSNGNLRTVRKTTAPAYARITYPDGTTEEIFGVTAQEWPWRKTEETPEWRIFGISREIFIRALDSRGIEAIAVLASEKGETILELARILPLIMHSANSETGFMGVEIIRETPPAIN